MKVTLPSQAGSDAGRRLVEWSHTHSSNKTGCVGWNAEQILPVVRPAHSFYMISGYLASCHWYVVNFQCSVLHFLTVSVEKDERHNNAIGKREHFQVSLTLKRDTDMDENKDKMNSPRTNYNPHSNLIFSKFLLLVTSRRKNLAHCPEKKHTLGQGIRVSGKDLKGCRGISDWHYVMAICWLHEPPNRPLWCKFPDLFIKFQSLNLNFIYAYHMPCEFSLCLTNPEIISWK